MIQVKNMHDLHFKGPIKFSEIGESQFAESEGIYIWVLKDIQHEINYMHYIGETTNFYSRFRVHLIDLLGINYRIYDIPAAKQGVNSKVWTGMWTDKSKNAIGKTIENYAEIAEKTIEYANYIDIYFAPINWDGVELTTEWKLKDWQKQRNVRKHFEGCIAWYYRENFPELQVMYEADNMTGRQQVELTTSVNVTCDARIEGLIKVIVRREVL